MKDSVKEKIIELYEKYGDIEVICDGSSYLPIDSLVKFQGNLKNLSEKNLLKLAKIIFYHGFAAPFFTFDNKGDWCILDGTQRREVILAIREAGVPIPGQFPVIEIKADSEQKAREILLGITGSYGEFQKDVLDEWIADIDCDIAESLRIVDTELELAIASLAGDTAGDDLVPEDVATITELGDLWELGNHRLLCGDSTNYETVGKLMDGQKADMVFTDPLYGIEYQSSRRTDTEKFEVLKNDDTILDIYPIINKFSKGWIFIWTSWKVQNQWIEKLIQLKYPTNMVIWYKPGGGIGDLKKTFSSDYEVALVWHRGADLCGKRIGSVWKINKDGASTYIHPTQKPVELSVEAIDKTTNKKDIVLDLFGGSGSTLIGCEQTDRQCFMMELDPHYCDVIRGRYIQWCKTNSRECSIKLNGMPFDIGTLLNQGINREREL